jgi:hypothetical protein
MFHAFSSYRSLARLIALSITGLAIAGCGGSAKPQGTVTGQVKYQGNPLTAGEVNLMQKETGTGATASLDKTGRFKLASPILTGSYNVSFTPPVPKQLPPGSPLEAPPPFPIPPKYQDPVQSDLKVEVKKGANDLNITVPES